MVSSVIAAAVVLLLALWHLRNRRRPGWRTSSEGRSYLLCGYSVVASSTYWLFTPPVGTWEWVFAGAWLLAGIVAFVLGFRSIDRAAESHVASPKAEDTARTRDEPRKPTSI